MISEYLMMVCSFTTVYHWHHKGQSVVFLSCWGAINSSSYDCISTLLSGADILVTWAALKNFFVIDCIFLNNCCSYLTSAGRLYWLHCVISKSKSHQVVFNNFNTANILIMCCSRKYPYHCHRGVFGLNSTPQSLWKFMFLLFSPVEI